jgi:hypothetical protein
MQVSNPFVTIKKRNSQMYRENKLLKGGKRSAFFTGGNSTCRTHIRGHYDVYEGRCKEKGIPINHHAIPRDILKQRNEEKENGNKQVKINDILPKSTGPKEFTREGVLHAVAQFVVCDDQVWPVARRIDLIFVLMI